MTYVMYLMCWRYTLICSLLATFITTPVVWNQYKYKQKFKDKVNKWNEFMQTFLWIYEINHSYILGFISTVLYYFWLPAILFEEYLVCLSK